MNSCILMAEIVQEPQLRYTTDQTPLAEMLVEFPALRAEEPPATLKVVGWGNLAQEIQQNYHQGDRVIIEGRLTMNTFERSDGIKEKRAELTVQKIHSLGDGVSIGSSPTGVAAARNVTAPSMEERVAQAPPQAATERRNTTVRGAGSVRNPEQVEEASAVGVLDRFDQAEPLPQPTTPQVPTYPVSTSEQDVDDIPF